MAVAKPETKRPAKRIRIQLDNVHRHANAYAMQNQRQMRFRPLVGKCEGSAWKHRDTGTSLVLQLVCPDTDEWTTKPSSSEARDEEEPDYAFRVAILFAIQRVHVGPL